MKLVIERKTWLRGGQFGSQLMRPANAEHDPGKKCCLGFFALACGYKAEDIEDCGTPYGMFVNNSFSRGESAPRHVPAQIPAFVEHLVRQNTDTVSGLDNTDLARELMKVNDDTYITDATREARLRTLFAQMNVEVEFVDEVSA